MQKVQLSGRWLPWVLCSALVVTVFTGCGESGPKTYPVTGTVTTGGKPVTGGSLTFAPIGVSGDQAIQPSVTTVQSDGTYKLDKGTVPAKHRVLYVAPVIPWEMPEWDGKGKAPEAPKSEFDGLVPKESEVEITAGENKIDIELVPPTR